MIGSWSVTLGHKLWKGKGKGISCFTILSTLSTATPSLVVVLLLKRSFIVRVSLAQSGWVQSKSCTANKMQPSPNIFNKKSNNAATPVIPAARDNNHHRLIWLFEFRRAHTAGVNHSTPHNPASFRRTARLGVNAA